MRYTPITAASALAIALAGCGHTATIHARGQADYTARVVGADREQVWIDPEGPEPAFALSRATIDDIDHPGNWAMVGGAVLGGGGLLFTVLGGAGVFVGGEGWPESLLVFGMGAGALSLGGWVFYDGYDRWSTSKAAAAPGAGPPTRVALTPAGLRVTF